MKARDLIFIAIVLAVIGGLYYLSTKNKAKPMPADPPEHLTVTSREECLKCHLPEKLAELELKHKHPGKWKDERVSCLLCHPAPQGAKRTDLNKSQISNLILKSQISNLKFKRDKRWPQPKQN